MGGRAWSHDRDSCLRGSAIGVWRRNDAFKASQICSLKHFCCHHRTREGHSGPMEEMYAARDRIHELIEGLSTFDKRSERVVLETNTDYWDTQRLPRLHRIVFDNTLSPKEALELVKNDEGRVDLVNELRPLETLRVAQSQFAKVVKRRGSLVTVFGQFNMRQAGGLWREVRLRQALNYAINREDLIRYATKGNGVIIPALLPERAFGHDPDLAPYPFEPSKAQQLLREAGYPPGRPLVLIATEDLEVQATVVSKMLEQVGLTVQMQMLDAATYTAKTNRGRLDQPPGQQRWDIALRSIVDTTG